MSSEELLRYFSWLCRIATALFLTWLLLRGHASAATAGDGPSPADRAQAQELYTSTCVSCHGERGGGDGLAGTSLPAKPASFADAAWQSRTSDQEIDRAIVGGGAAVGKSPLMPANPALASKPEVVAALRAMIRGFAPNPPR